MTWDSGIINYSINSSGIANQGGYFSSSIVPSSDAFTISFWLNPYRTDLSYQGILDFRSSRQLAIVLHSNNIAYYVGGANYIDIAETISTDEWSFWAFSYNGTTFQTYKNGTLVDSRETSIPSTSETTYSWVSIQYDNSFPSYSKIDEIGIWNRSLNDTEILDLSTIITYSNMEAPEEPEPEPQITYQSNPIYQIMESSGAGLGIFLQTLGQGIGGLLIVLIIISVIAIIGYAIARAIPNMIKRWQMKNER
jgi:hypothetical protein